MNSDEHHQQELEQQEMLEWEKEWVDWIFFQGDWWEALDQDKDYINEWRYDVQNEPL